MLRLSALASLALTVFLPCPARAQTLFSEGFDSQVGAKVRIARMPDTDVQFVDYSSFTIGTVSHSIPEAPGRLAGSTATRGVLMRANLTSSTAQAANLTALESVGGNPATFTGNYRMTFDMYLSLDPTATTASAGTTEQGGWCVGTNGNIIVGRVNRDNPGLTGTWGWLATENGFGTEDAIIIENVFPQKAKVDNTNHGSLFETAFPNGSPIQFAANNTWTRVEITVLEGFVTVKFNNVEFFRIASTSTNGFAALTYEDFFTSLSFSPFYQFGLFDNWKIEVAFVPTIEVVQTGLFSAINVENATSTGTFSVRNTGPTDLTVTGVNFTGTDGSAFSSATPLPLVIAPGNNKTLAVTFTASGAFGEKRAQMEVASTDALQPTVTRQLKAVYAPVLLAHYPFDETAGTVVVEASGNGPNGAYQVRQAPLALGQPLLASGTSVRLLAANDATTGNYAFMRPLHVPTTSISLWIKPEADNSATDVLFNRDPGFTGADRIYGCFLDDSGTVTFRSGGNVSLESPPAAITDGQTHHLVITHLDTDGFGNLSAVRARMYIDGLLVAENTTPPGFDDYPVGSSATSLHIGTRTAAGAGYSGLIDDLQIYSIELQPFQVAAMFAAPGTTAVLTDPPPLAITAVAFNASTGEMRVTWNSFPGRYYAIDTSTNLVTWEEWSDSTLSAGLSTTEVITGLNAITNPQLYVRIREL